MYDVHMATVSEEFARCWKAAGLHIENQAQGPLQSWLRAHLNPPFLEHLSFRLGNQLFFIQLEDVDGRLETPGNPDGLLAIADGCAGHACVMPMCRVGADWEPEEPGWGLLDARFRQPVNPPALISDEKIVMTDWELQDLAVQVVRNQLDQEGRELMSWNGDPRVNPSLWFVGDAGPEWVVVRAARYPLAAPEPPSDLAEIQSHFNKSGYPGHFAAVVVAGLGDPFDLNSDTDDFDLPLYRGYPMDISYEGLQRFKS